MREDQVGREENFPLDSQMETLSRQWDTLVEGTG